MPLNRHGKPPRVPVDSQTWAPQGTASWRKGAPAPRPGGGLAGAPELKLAGQASQGPCGLPDLGPSGYGKLEERSTHPMAWWGFRRGP
ncbi:hypothetical protein NDU88_006207 [Pleurodeles waltl]|uniref:Uncharacterized protein n=1 Tax=Pleurodeles waltl TaxID=8319 RepID=A0AAV7VNZ1_PLEWA|nr:hypothetical protein NDU88_006207 [Pleurodeles waltl]